MRAPSAPLPSPGMTHRRPSAVRASTSFFPSPVKSPIAVRAVYCCHPRRDGRARQPAADAVAAVQVRRAVRGAGQDVGDAVATQVTGAKQRRELLPPTPDLAARAGAEPATPVARVQEQATVRPSSHEVGETVTVEVTDGDHEVERPSSPLRS